MNNPDQISRTLWLATAFTIALTASCEEHTDIPGPGENTSSFIKSSYNNDLSSGITVRNVEVHI